LSREPVEILVRILALFLLPACAAPVTVSGSASLPGDDANSTDSGGGGDADADTDADTDADPVYELDFSEFTGERHFFYDYTEYGDEYYCDETVEESGVEVESVDMLAALEDACGLCQYFVEITEISDDNPCYGIELGTSYRGIALVDDRAAIYLYSVSNGWGGDGGVDEYANDEHATWSEGEGELGFATTGEVYRYFEYEIDGWMKFDLVEVK
jgi:hypothetical protein